jgi:hypothetical protein
MFPPVRLLAVLAFLGSAAELPAADIAVDPASVVLHGPTARWSLLVSGKGDSGRLLDRTHDAQYRSVDPKIARVTRSGVIFPVADGKTSIVVEVAGQSLQVPVTVEQSTAARRFHFESDIVPLLSRHTCNASGCHGKAEGQNGFKLSVFGFDPAADYAALVKEGRGRRVFPSAPEASLLIRKMSGQTAHGGGSRIPRGSDDYETIRAWVAAGVPFGGNDVPEVVAVRVEPRERVLAPHGQQQLRVVARFSDGRDADVTHHARFQSNNEGLAAVEASGLVTAGDVPGEAAVMVSYRNAVDVFRAVVPRPQAIARYPAVPENNFIDKLTFARLRKLNLVPSELADDAEFLRRVYLDVIGTLPTPEEARRFLADRRADKRSRLVDELLERSEYADYWSLKWADLLRVERQILGRKRAYAYYRWLREAVARNRPYDEFVRELITADGLLNEVAPASFYKAVPKPGEASSTLAQVFLGVRIACAECHHHPFDRWTQDDYYGMQAFFVGVSVRKGPRDELLQADGLAKARNPRSAADIFAHALGEKMPASLEAGDQRPALAAWMTRADNPWFARNLANRMWAHFLGRGLVEPVDDVRSTNPPTNPELLDALADHLVKNKYDVKALIRAITGSRVYQLSSTPNETNERDEQNYSRAPLKRIPAEVLLDMVSQTTGVAERFAAMPVGTRAIQLWDSKASHYFLKVFGRPERISACECERNAEPSVAQVLHLLNAPEIHAKLSHEGGAIAKRVKRFDKDEALVEELYLSFYSRPPTAEEKKTGVAYLEKGKADRRQATEDLAWSLMNSLEFVFNH